jgi:hypothetical protein
MPRTSEAGAAAVTGANGLRVEPERASGHGVGEPDCYPAVPGASQAPLSDSPG